MKEIYTLPVYTFDGVRKCVSGASLYVYLIFFKNTNYFFDLLTKFMRTQSHQL